MPGQTGRYPGAPQRRAQLSVDVELPYDPREEGSPGVPAASVLVHSLIVDQSEASEPDDATWLDVIPAVHRHLPRGCSGLG